jgi:hypothetical protein
MTPPEDIKTTPIPNGWETAELEKKLKNTFGPINSLASDRVQKNIWAGIAIVSLLGGTIAPLVLWMRFEKALSARQYVFALDGSQTIHAGPLEDLNMKSEVFSVTALNAAQAALQRSPVGLDLPEMVRGLFTEAAEKELRESVEAQMPDIKARNLHQKPEVSEVTALSEKAGFRILEVKGQLIRAGNLGGTALSEPSLPFQLLLQIKPNPRMNQRGQYPFVVTDFKFRLTNKS